MEFVGITVLFLDEKILCSSMYKITDHPFLIRFISLTIIDEIIIDAPEINLQSRLDCSTISKSNDDQIRPRQRRSRGGMGSQSRGSSSHVQDSVSPHSSYHTSPSPLLAPAAPAPAAAPAPGPAAAPGPLGVMRVAELVRQPGRDHLPYLTEYPHGHGQTWFNRSGNGISAWINRMMYSALDSGHPTFTHFPTWKQCRS
ncbi:uncharacterized protein LOC117127785 [Brassica rapa]|uniref:uncharacterized protein LOC117127785 n=1 Tax=Brassica campestris TaxID=3711 RepID=UPI00142E31CB|nr:uncharacterized protein LOC117127785 [Brassica rapa]